MNRLHRGFIRANRNLHRSNWPYWILAGVTAFVYFLKFEGLLQ